DVGRRGAVTADHLRVEPPERVGEQRGKVVVVVVEGTAANADAIAHLDGGDCGPALLDKNVDGGVGERGFGRGAPIGLRAPRRGGRHEVQCGATTSEWPPTRVWSTRSAPRRSLP